jgi:hypothetical protein
MRLSRAFGLIIAISQIASLATFGLSLHTVSAILTNSLGGDGLTFELKVDDVTGGGVLDLEIEPVNQGYLGADFMMELSLIDSTGTTVATDSTSAYLEPGSVKALGVSLHISKEEFERIYDEWNDSTLNVTVGLRTLYDLVGVSNTVSLQGGSNN